MRIRTKATISGISAVVVSIAITTVTILLLIRVELTRQAYSYQDSKMRVFHEPTQTRKVAPRLPMESSHTAIMSSTGTTKS